MKNPEKCATGFSGFSVSGKATATNRPQKRVRAFDDYGKLLFHLCASQLEGACSNEQQEQEFQGEPAYKHLLDLAAGAKQVDLGEVQGNYYREDSTLLNHVDSDGILFTMVQSR